MRKLFKTIFITLLLVFSAFSSVKATQSALEVIFEKEPLFKEVNFLPGEVISRWVKVINHGDDSQRIAVQAINVSDPDGLGDALNLEIKEGQAVIYNDSLSTFFGAGEVFLSELAGLDTGTQYDFSVGFAPDSGNQLQGKSLGFDILIGFQGTEGGILPGAGSGGGGGGGLPPGLSIYDESVKVTDIEEVSVTINWTTSYLSTSQVIFSTEGEPHTLDLTDNSGIPPTYGYASTSPEYDVVPKVKNHAVIITGLTPGATYYYRAVSHASPPTISREYSFTTLGAKVEEEIGEEIDQAGPPPFEEELPGQIALAPTGQGEIKEPSDGELVEGEAGIEEGTGEGTGEGIEEDEEKLAVGEPEDKEGAGRFLAAIGEFFSGLDFKSIIFILAVILIALLIGLVLSSRRKKKRSKIDITTDSQ